MALTLAAVIPEVVLQSVEHQNDLVCRILCYRLVLFLFKKADKKSTSISNYFLLGLSLGLGIIAKGTTYIYAAPILFVADLVLYLPTYLRQGNINTSFMD